MTLEYLAKVIFPQLIKRTNDDNTCLRIWSAGCAKGEEPYTASIIIKEYLESLKLNLCSYIIGTDINEHNLKDARKGIYNTESLKDVTLDILNKYFSKEHKNYKITPEIQNMVKFSKFDLLEEKHFAPKDSIFAGFDMIFCRNVLYYFKPEAVNQILNKFYKSLAPKGILVLGNSEILPDTFNHLFCNTNQIVPVYRKNC